MSYAASFFNIGTVTTSTCIPDHVVNLTPAAADLLENQQSVAVKAALLGEHFSQAVAVQIEMLDVVDAGKEFFGRRLVGLELHKVGDELVGLRLVSDREAAGRQVRGRLCEVSGVPAATRRFPFQHRLH